MPGFGPGITVAVKESDCVGQRFLALYKICEISVGFTPLVNISMKCGVKIVHRIYCGLPASID